MNNKLLYLVLMSLILLPAYAAGQDNLRIPKPGSVLSTLYKPHPRLLIQKDGIERIKRLRDTDDTLRKYMGDVLTIADDICTKPVLTYKAREGYRLMSVSRECIRRMYTLGMAWFLTGDEKYARKAEEDLLAVSSFDNWTPSLTIIYPLQEKHKRAEEKSGRTTYSFLDVSETTHAVGIGYDWFYHYLSEQSREKIKSGLIKNGLELGVQAYTGKGKESGIKDEWTTYNHNWNMVCNGGLIVGALAIAETDPDYAKVIIPGAVESLPIALTTYGPDGAWPEGPSYWGYATRYTVFGLAALQSALGTDFRLSEIKGLSETGLFPLYTTGPTGMYLNFADSPENNRRRSIPCLFWLGKRYGSSFVSNQEHQMIGHRKTDPLHLVWYEPYSQEGSHNLDLDKHFRGDVEIALFRSTWNDENALFAGVKAGDNTFNHAHLDLGSFELEALGVKWIRDLGRDDYSLPGLFDFYYLTGKRGGQRWTYYRNNSFSHNIPILDGSNQDELAKAKFLKFESGPSFSYVTVDLTDAYAQWSGKTTRGVGVVGKHRAVLVQDEFDMKKSCDVRWGITTNAVIETNGSQAKLVQDGEIMTARILAPKNARFTVESAEQESPQSRNEGASRLVIDLGKQTGSVRITVLFSPHWEDGEIEDAEVRALEEW
ncbi:heparinase II/III family protein [Candidatus Omnitrophota bacterium]